MIDTVPSPLEAWGNFNVIVGSSAGALTGLQFVVMTLLPRLGPGRGRGESISAFGTPNVVHFSAALLIASILSVPWTSLAPAGATVAVCGGAGVLYCVVVLRRARRQQEYQPVFEDWLWHTILPFLAYGTVLVSGVVAAGGSARGLFPIGGATLTLVFIGIHNAWDTVTYLAVGPGYVEPLPDVPGGANTAAPTTASGSGSNPDTPAPA